MTSRTGGRSNSRTADAPKVCIPGSMFSDVSGAPVSAPAVLTRYSETAHLPA